MKIRKICRVILERCLRAKEETGIAQLLEDNDMFSEMEGNLVITIAS